MKRAFTFLNKENWQPALDTAPHGVGKTIVMWYKLRAGEGALSDYEVFLQNYSDWPGLPLLKEAGEEAVARSTTPKRIIAYFTELSPKEPPKTGKGATALVWAYKTTGNFKKAEEVALNAWLELPFSAQDERKMLALFPGNQKITAAHAKRYDTLLWQNRWDEADQMKVRVGASWRKLAKTRKALGNDLFGVDKLITALPQEHKQDPGLAYERFDWRMRREYYDDAADLLLEQSDSPEELEYPGVWAPQRAILARWLLRQGQAQDAYRLASRHYVAQGGQFADLEFLSGFIALRRLGQPQKALNHFKRLEAGVSTPISKSRALYWQGRAYESMRNRQAAREKYRQAAQYQTAYYGLLAAEELKMTLDNSLLKPHKPGSWHHSQWTKSSVHQAAFLFLKTGNIYNAKRFWLHLGESLSDTELQQMGDMMVDMKESHLAVAVGKAGAKRNKIIPVAYYPIADSISGDLLVSRAFALAIARRESEFYPKARSHSGALGLMQLLPATASDMAKKLSLKHDVRRLTTDPNYNVLLGTAYLNHLQERYDFGTSIALLAAGYNAGPNRTAKWIEKLGDPRSNNVDVVDWVEMIPIGETRNYIMRVAEAVVIYRAKLRGYTGPINIIEELKG